MSTLFLRASRIRDIGFTKYLLDYISKNNVGVNQKFIDKIDSTLDRFKKNIIEYVRNLDKLKFNLLFFKIFLNNYFKGEIIEQEK